MLHWFPSIPELPTVNAVATIMRNGIIIISFSIHFKTYLIDL